MASVFAGRWLVVGVCALVGAAAGACGDSADEASNSSQRAGKSGAAGSAGSATLPGGGGSSAGGTTGKAGADQTGAGGSAIAAGGTTGHGGGVITGSGGSIAGAGAGGGASGSTAGSGTGGQTAGSGGSAPPPPPAPTCADGAKNQDETGVDCGGPCPACPNGQGCSGPASCQSGNCDAGVCQPPPCANGVRDGAESDVDCGGGCAAKCGLGAGCNGPDDCTNGSCVQNACTIPTCSDFVKNGDEVETDCGGPCVPCECAGYGLIATLPGHLGSGDSEQFCNAGTSPNGEGTIYDDLFVYCADGRKRTCFTALGVPPGPECPWAAGGIAGVMCVVGPGAANPALDACRAQPGSIGRQYQCSNGALQITDIPGLPDGGF